MAFKTSDIGGYGSGALGTVLNPSGQINSYANVTAIATNTVTIGTPSNGVYETFVVGKEILLHVSAITSGSDLQYLGKYMVATITAVNGSTLTLSKDVSGLIASGVLSSHHVQAITIAQFDTLNLTATIAPLAYNFTNKYGGILAIKGKTAINLSGSARIDLVAKGIPIANVAVRPATSQEGNANQIGWENHITARQFYLNCPDGAAFIVATTISNTGTTARIGAATAGVALYPYNGGATSTTPVKGGPTILMAAQSVTGFDVSLIAKTSSNTSGNGLGRCYIATESKIPADEGLYALDCLSNPARLAGMGIKDYGTGTLGTVLSLSGQINSYAAVSAISADGKTLTIGAKYEGIYEKFAAGSRVMFHVSRQTGSDGSYLGKFILATVLSISGGTVVLDSAVTGVVASNVLSNYKCQLLTVAQFDTLAWSGNYTASKAYDDSHGCGGILAIAAKTAFDLQGGQLNMEGKGIPVSVSRPAVTWQCSGKQGDCLPLSQGGGAILLIAKQLKVNSASRIGSSFSGATYNGLGGYAATNTYPAASAGSPGTCFKSGDGGRGTVSDIDNAAGPGAIGVIGKGVCGNSVNSGVPGAAGASVFIVADTIVDFTMAAISVGGLGGLGGAGPSSGGPGQPGGAGYAGGGGGGGATYANQITPGSGNSGGAPGSVFIYANTLTNPDNTALLAA